MIPRQLLHFLTLYSWTRRNLGFSEQLASPIPCTPFKFDTCDAIEPFLRGIYSYLNSPSRDEEIKDGYHEFAFKALKGRECRLVLPLHLNPFFIFFTSLSVCIGVGSYINLLRNKTRINRCHVPSIIKYASVVRLLARCHSAETESYFKTWTIHPSYFV